MFQKENLLPTLFQILGFAALSTFVFMGCMYSMNDIKIAIFTTVVAVLLLAILSYYLLVWKTKKKRGNDELVNKLPEVLLGSAYAIIAIFLFLYSNHYFNIEFNKKAILRKEVETKVTDFSKMLNKYQQKVSNKVSEFEIEVTTNKSYINSSNANLRANGKNELTRLLGADYGNDIAAINTAMNNKKSWLSNKVYGDDSISNAIKNYTTDINHVFSNWEITQVKYKYDNIDEEFAKYYKLLQKKMPDFEFTYAISTQQFPSVFASLSTASFVSIFFGLIIYLLAHIFILGKYLFTERVDNNLVDGPKKGVSGNVADLYKTKKI